VSRVAAAARKPKKIHHCLPRSFGEGCANFGRPLYKLPREVAGVLQGRVPSAQGLSARAALDDKESRTAGELDQRIIPRVTLLYTSSVADLLEVVEAHWIERGRTLCHHHTRPGNCVSHVEVLHLAKKYVDSRFERSALDRRVSRDRSRFQRDLPEG